MIDNGVQRYADVLGKLLSLLACDVVGYCHFHVKILRSFYLPERLSRFTTPFARWAVPMDAERFVHRSSQPVSSFRYVYIRSDCTE